MHFLLDVEFAEEVGVEAGEVVVRGRAEKPLVALKVSETKRQTLNG
jgi:hypothetical protein